MYLVLNTIDDVEGSKVGLSGVWVPYKRRYVKWARERQKEQYSSPPLNGGKLTLSSHAATRSASPVAGPGGDNPGATPRK